MELKHIFEALTPDNIKDIPLIETAMEIFTETLEENSAISLRIKEIYNNSYDPNDSQMLQDSKKELRSAIISVYLSALFTSITKAQSDPVVNAKLNELGLTDVLLSEDTTKILTDENFLTNKEFKEKIGTEIGIEYAYNLSNYLESAETFPDLNLEEIKPFHFKTEGGVLKEMYENVIKPLSHPLGFTYYYTQIIELLFQDTYGITVLYDVHAIEIRGLNGYFDVFTEDSDDINVKADFLTRINPLTEILFTEAEYNEQVTVWADKVVEEFYDGVQENRALRSILFTDGTYLERYTNPVEILYTTYASWLDGTNIPIKEYDGHYSLYSDFDTDYEFQYIDTLTSKETTYMVDEYLVTDEIDDTGGDIHIWSDDGLYLVSEDGLDPPNQEYFYTTDAFYLHALVNP